MTAMTWPIDLAEELKELDDEEDVRADYTTLLQAQLQYKAAMLRPGVVKALFDIMLPPLAKDKKYAPPFSPAFPIFTCPISLTFQPQSPIYRSMKRKNRTR